MTKGTQRMKFKALLLAIVLAPPSTQASSLDNTNGPFPNIQEGNISTEFTETDQYFDLTAFGEAVGNSQIVLLDEATHGEGNIFALKARLVKYLHEKKGFDVLLLESGLYDVSRIWLNDQEPIAQQAPGNIFYMYANSAEMQPLYTYIDTKRNAERPLYFAGFDNRHSGGLSNAHLVSSLKEYLISEKSSIPSSADWPFFKAIAKTLIAAKTGESDATEQSRFRKVSKRIAAFTQLKATNNSLSPFQSALFWHRIIKSLSRMADVSWGLRPIPDHDLEMTENIRWLMKTVYPGKKAIIWGHYVHLTPNGNPDHSKMVKANVGTGVTDIWPNSAYSVHFAGGKGSYTNFITMKQVTIPKPTRNSLEAALNARNMQSAFIDSQHLDISGNEANDMTVWTYDYKYQMQLTDWKQHWDSMFFMNPITPVNYLTR